MYCNKCNAHVTEDDILDAYGNDEDMIVMIQSTGLCPECYENSISFDNPYSYDRFLDDMGYS